MQSSMRSLEPNSRKLNEKSTKNRTCELFHCSQNKMNSQLWYQSSFQPELDNHSKQSVLLEDVQVPQEAQDQLLTLLQVTFYSIVLKSHKDVGRTNLFEMDIPTTGSPLTHKPYPIPLKYQKFANEEIELLESSGCTSKSLSP